MGEMAPQMKMRIGDGRMNEATDASRGLPSRATPYEDLPEFLSPEEFGAYLVLSRNTTYDLLRRGEVPHLKFGRAIRIPKTALRFDTAKGHVR